jgi:SAM-dependent methyltransferase
VLRDITGPGGQVVGVDASAASLAAARTVLSRLGAPEVTLVVGDINTVGLGALGGPASFDLVFSRLTLMHQPDPVATARRFGQLLRPGGALVAFDLSHRRPPNRATRRSSAPGSC